MKNKKILGLSLLLLPKVVFSSNGNDNNFVLIALIIEVFISILMILFVLKPLSKMFSKVISAKVFWILFFIRILIILNGYFLSNPFIFVYDFLAFVIGALGVVPICSIITKTAIFGNNNKNLKSYAINNETTPGEISGIELRCAKCNSILNIGDKVCSKCGEAFDGNNVVVVENPNSTIHTPRNTPVLSSSFDAIYNLSEDDMLEAFIYIKLKKVGIDENSKLIPSDILKRKKILNIIFSILVFVFISLIFFHFPIYTYILGIIILFIFFRVTKKYNFIKYLKKQIKARPGEKIINILMSTKNTLVDDNSKSVFIVSLLVAIILPLIIFSSPRIIYEKVDGGYAVRYYIYGLINFKTATIPQTYKNENIVSLRGNTFSNMYFLESISLPDSITEIRGQAFKNCYALTKVNMPEKLEYLGGGAFYNARSLKEVEFFDALTYLGGESFYGAESLEYVKLSNNLIEIRGDSFEYCTSLKTITIPDSVTRIGGHAFYGDSSLSEVIIGENSKLKEIGSSAFRKCSSLYSIDIPYETYVNERSFKESPTKINRYNSKY